MEIKVPKILEAFGGTQLSNIKRIIDNRISRIHTTSIGIIESFDPEKQTAVIQPAIKRVITVEDRDTITYSTENTPLLVNVPIVFPGGGDWFMTFPIKKGDECIIFSMERSIGNWKKNGGIQDPSSYKRKLSYKDAVAIVGIQSNASSLPSFNADEPELRNRDGSTKLTMGSSGMVITGDLEVKGEIKADAEVSANNATLSVSLSTHAHSDVIIAADGGVTGTSGSPVPGT